MPSSCGELVKLRLCLLLPPEYPCLSHSCSLEIAERRGVSQRLAEPYYPDSMFSVWTIRSRSDSEDKIEKSGLVVHIGAMVRHGQKS